MARARSASYREPPECTLPWTTDEQGRPLVTVAHWVQYRVVVVEGNGVKDPRVRGRMHWEIEWRVREGAWDTVRNAATGACREGRPRMYFSEHAAKLAVENLPLPRSRR